MIDLVAFGEVLWDIFQVEEDDFRREIGGAPANVAVQVARLGGTAAVVGAVGRDAFGVDLDARLRAEGVDTRALAKRPERTGIAFVLRSDDGQPRFLFYRQATADMAFGISDLPKVLPRAHFALVGSSTLVVPHLAEATWAFVERARAGKTAARIIVDLNVRAHLWRDRTQMRDAVAALLAPAFFVKASADDLAALDVGSEARALAWVRDRAPGATILVTRGAKSASAFGAFGRVDAPVKPARCVDATGAGDAFLAGVVRVFAALPKPLRQAPSAVTMAEALRLGNAMGSRVVGKRGAVAVDTTPLRARSDRAIARLTALR